MFRREIKVGYIVDLFMFMCILICLLLVEEDNLNGIFVVEGVLFLNFGFLKFFLL